MIIKIDKNNLKYNIFAFLFLIPYFEIGPIRNMLEINFTRNIIEASIALLIIFSMIMAIFLLYKKRKLIDNNILLIYIFIIILQLPQVLSANDFTSSFVTLLYFTIPLVFAGIYHNCVKNFDYCILIKKIVLFFIVYLLINTLINIIFYGFSITAPTGGNRLLSPGGGPVALGYTTCIVFILMLSIDTKYSKMVLFCFSMFFLIISFLTGSRGSMWPVLAVFLIYWVRLSVKNFILLSFLLFIFIFYFNKIVEFFPRLFSIGQESRVMTWESCVKIFINENTITQFFGKGFGCFFPYNTWLHTVSDGVYNTFSYNGVSLLVQPHSNWVYMLLEGGIINLIIFIVPFAKFLKRCLQAKKMRLLLYMIFIILLSGFDSTYFVSPATSTVWWISILMLYDLIK